MKSPSSLFIGFNCVLTGIAGMQIVVVSLSYFGRGETQRLNTLVWAACAAAFFALNIILRKKPVSVPVLALANAALSALSLFVIITTAHSLSGFWGYLITVAMTLVTAVISFRYSGKTQTPSSQLVIFDMYIVLLFWQFLIMSSGMPGDDIPFLLFVLLLNIICNLAVRSREQNMRPALRVHLVRGLVFYVGLLAVMCAFVFGLIRLFSSTSRYAVAVFFDSIWNGVRYVLALLTRFFDWFFTLFKYDDKGMGIVMDTPATAGTETGIDQFRIRPEILYILTALLALAVVVGFVIAVYRFRKTRLHGSSLVSPAQQQVPVRRKGSGRVRSRAKALLRGMVFTVKSLLYINTPPGTLVRLERWGKRRGKKRRPGQTMREYLLSLSSELLPIADDLDLMYFGSGSGMLTKDDCRRIRRDFFRNHIEKGTELL